MLGGDAKDRSHSDLREELLKDRGGPQSPWSLATKVASVPSRSSSQHLADGQQRWERRSLGLAPQGVLLWGP